MLSRLVSTIGAVDGLPEELCEQAQDAFFHADHPFLTVLVGTFGSGKSSIINALLGEPLLPVGPTPTTDRIVILRYGESVKEIPSEGKVTTLFHPAPILERTSLVDTPGLESVFRQHEALTRRFLHRSDLVFMVMLATHAMTAGSMEYLRRLREYGKRIVVLINQIDLLEPAQVTEVRDFVIDQSKAYLGFVPEVWPVSAKMALDAGSRSEEDPNWAGSGFGALLEFMDGVLEDRKRHRQKLATSLQIAEHVAEQALEILADSRERLSDQQGIVASIRAQIDEQVRQQSGLVAETRERISEAFERAGRRGAEAIRHTFRLTAALGMLGRGLAEVFGLARAARRLGARSPARKAFDEARAFEPLDDVPDALSRLEARLEARDMQDVDGLVGYTRERVAQLPDVLKSRLIGKIEPPGSYNRELFKETRSKMNDVLRRAKTAEFDKIDREVRGALLGLALWELLVVAVAVLSRIVIGDSDLGSLSPTVVAGLFLALVLAGFAITPIRGLIMAHDYTKRLQALQNELLAVLDRNAKSYIEYARSVRDDTVRPFVTLVSSQAGKLATSQDELEAIRAEICELKAELDKPEAA